MPQLAICLENHPIVGPKHVGLKLFRSDNGLRILTQANRFIEGRSGHSKTT